MKICVIPPLAHNELMNEGDMIFVLAQLYLKDESYRKFVKKKKKEGWFLILDNGAGDHDLVTQDMLIEACKDLMPNEVIPPDYLFDKDKTIEGCDLFIEQMQAEGLIDQVNIFFCPQGVTKEEWLECYEYGINNSFVSTIGLSKIAVPYAWNKVKGDQLIMESRHEAYDYLKERGFIVKPIHCLGAGHPNEFEHYAGDKMMRSTDSCFSVLAALNYISWRKGDFTRIKTPKDYFQDQLTEAQINVAHSNISYLREVCEEKADKIA